MVCKSAQAMELPPIVGAQAGWYGLFALQGRLIAEGRAGWCHPPIREAQAASEDGATRRFAYGRKPETVPPVSPVRRQAGATRQSGGANWCHP